MPISDTEAENAADYLRDNAAKFGRLRGDRIYAEEYRKSLKAMLMAMHADKPVGVQEREAYRDPTYREHLQKIRDAVEAEETERAYRIAAEMKISVWQTESANLRGRI